MRVQSFLLRDGRAGFESPRHQKLVTWYTVGRVLISGRFRPWRGLPQVAAVAYRGGRANFKFQLSLLKNKNLFTYPASSRRPPKNNLTDCTNKEVVGAGNTSGHLGLSPPAIHSRVGAAATARTFVVRGTQARCYCFTAAQRTPCTEQAQNKHRTSTQKNKAVSDTAATNLRGEEVVELGQLGQIMDEGVQLPSEDVVHEPRRRAAVEGRSWHVT